LAPLLLGLLVRRIRERDGGVGTGRRRGREVLRPRRRALRAWCSGAPSRARCGLASNPVVGARGACRPSRRPPVGGGRPRWWPRRRGATRSAAVPTARRTLPPGLRDAAAAPAPG